MNYVTYGGVTVGLCLLIHHLVTWYPGRKPLMKDPVKHAAKLLPFLASWSYGCLTTLGIGGLIGTASSSVLGLSNWLGDAALFWGVGEQPGQLAARATFVPLSGPGACLVLILTAGFIAAVKKAGEEQASILKRGAWCGITLGTSAGVAGFAAVPLAQAANWLGDTVYAAL
ncbi:hypothetical protein PV735_11300 [Streptomyces turgidiscabies]|uniref:Uncharacterized protein n=1 Tax=Streptomyces turgidiscabies (strain Car8) TaxID=698760 RepID=L7EQM3_STRT8|nr:hypothetical protein [Streptomyces turgidiscabies]ELP61753.1 hypothetical protein STRTUCAR8_06438 [Streptomyces turgidiscabies Car8]MDX3493270.1 hypothetical protein [Streptomyces turgidiscabies]GAQ70570.1 hypothetical protein T45_02306 [Streptomyces turgidiscabies]